MSEQFHIIIAGDESRPRSFQISKKNLLITITVTLISSCIFAIGSFFSAGLHTYNTILVKKMRSLETKMHTAKSAKIKLEDQLAAIIKQKEKELEDIKEQNALLVSQIELESTKKIAELEKKNLQQEATFKEERDHLLSTAVSELNERSEFIENVINDIGIKVKQKKGTTTQKNSGGPYIAAENGTYDELLFRADHYLKLIQTLPLGRPTEGPVTSWYGKRQDPINSKNAFHSGIDFRGKRGAPVHATAAGKVVAAGVNGGFGKYVKIDHGNGYATSFSHLQNYHVKKNDYVSRGQVIGLVGNTGRSTGPHLHYEVTYNGKTVNPSKFLKIANLTCSFKNALEK